MAVQTDVSMHEPETPPAMHAGGPESSPPLEASAIVPPTVSPSKALRSPSN
jgi:hypothetical protein